MIRTVHLYGMSESQLTRSTIIESAGHLIKNDAGGDYTPENVTRIAKLWSATVGYEITPAQVAMMLAHMRLARLATDPTHEDSWVDLAGYAALGGEVASSALAAS